MIILKLTAENIKRIKAVEITPDGNLVVIGGRNAQGKTSVLDSITYALAGASSHPDQPIRNGEDKAKIVCELDDLIVTRTFTPKGGSLMVSNKEGAKYASPQALLDELTGKLTFDPLAFARMQPREQLETLKSLVGLDFTEVDTERQELYDERAIVNREGKELKGAVDQMEEYQDVPENEISVSELMEELTIRESHNREIDGKDDAWDALSDKVIIQSEKVERLKKELEAEDTLLAKMQASQYDQRVEISTLHRVDEQDIRNQIEGADMTNRKVRSNRVLAKRKQLLDDKRVESVSLSAKIQDLDEAKAQALSDATFPIAGLSFNDGALGVMYNNIPFDQCSSSEQLRISLAMGLALNPKLKVILIRDGSLLDEENLKMIAEMAIGSDAQVWIERVGNKDKIAIVIEDGTVANQYDYDYDDKDE